MGTIYAELGAVTPASLAFTETSKLCQRYFKVPCWERRGLEGDSASMPCRRVHLGEENVRNTPPPLFPSETFSLSRDFQHLMSTASLKCCKVALLIISVMIVNKLQYFVDPFPFALQTKGQSH